MKDKRSNREKAWDRIALLVKVRRNAQARYDLVMTMDVGLKNGHYIAYLWDPSNKWDRLYDTASMKRISKKAQSRFDLAYEMLQREYQESNRHLSEILCDHVENSQSVYREKQSNKGEETMSEIKCVECDEILKPATSIERGGSHRCCHCDRVSRQHQIWEDEMWEQELADSLDD